MILVTNVKVNGLNKTTSFINPDIPKLIEKHGNQQNFYRKLLSVVTLLHHYIGGENLMVTKNT